MCKDTNECENFALGKAASAGICRLYRAGCELSATPPPVWIGGCKNYQSI